MANAKTGNPLYFDATSGASVTGEFMRILAVTWVSDGGADLDIAADDDFLLSDSSGNKIAGKRAEAAGDDFGLVFGYPGFPVNGVTVTTMDGGVCYVYLA